MLRAWMPGLLCDFCRLGHSLTAAVWACSWMAQGFFERSGAAYGKTGGVSSFAVEISSEKWLHMS